MPGQSRGTSPRSDAMATSVVSAGARAGLSDSETGRLEAAFRLAMIPREAHLPDDHDPAFLHPGRVILILLRDAGVTELDSLQVGALLESRDPLLRVARDVIEAEFGGAVAEARSAVPAPGADGLAERLVTLEPALATAALAERLDHLRHEHLREPVTPWRALADEVALVWLPVAERTSEPLARRYRHWLRTFERRL
jgi:hypothetical protein